MNDQPNKTQIQNKYDPSVNVRELVEASIKRIDDLRISENRRIDEVAEIRESNLKEILEIRANHTEKLAEKEASRLDSIRQVDVLNQAVAAKSALDAIQALAVVTTTNADNIRNTLAVTSSSNAKQVTDLAATIAVQSAATTDAMTVRIAALEKASAEGVGKGRVIDPQMEQLMTKVSNISDAQNTKKGNGEGMKNLWSLIIGGVLFLIGVASFIIKF